MGRDAFHLYKGEVIMRVMLFKLRWDVAKPVGAVPSPLTEELLSRLSHDFLDIDDRARKAAKQEELRLKSTQVWVTFGGAIVTAIIGATLALLYQFSSAQRDIANVQRDLAKIEGRLGALGGTLNVISFDELVRKAGGLEERIKSLEAKK
jgi:hypothetical protein